MKSSTSHRVFILKALRAGDEITPEDAVRRWNCWRPGARVYELRRMGIPVIDLNKNTKVRFARYFLQPEDRELEPNSRCERPEKASKGITRERDQMGKFIGKKTVKRGILGRAATLYKSGKTYPEIGEILGYPWQTIYKRLKPLREAGILKSRSPGQPRQLVFSELVGR